MRGGGEGERVQGGAGGGEGRQTVAVVVVEGEAVEAGEVAVEVAVVEAVDSYSGPNFELTLGWLRVNFRTIVGQLWLDFGPPLA